MTVTVTHLYRWPRGRHKVIPFLFRTCSFPSPATRSRLHIPSPVLYRLRLLHADHSNGPIRFPLYHSSSGGNHKIFYPILRPRLVAYQCNTDYMEERTRQLHSSFVNYSRAHQFTRLCCMYLQTSSRSDLGSISWYHT